MEVRDSKGRTATHQAAARNKVAILQFIVAHQQGDPPAILFPHMLILLFRRIRRAGQWWKHPAAFGSRELGPRSHQLSPRTVTKQINYKKSLKTFVSIVCKLIAKISKI